MFLRLKNDPFWEQMMTKQSTTDDNDGLDSGKVRKLVSTGKMGCTLCDGRTPLFAKIFTIDLYPPTLLESR